MPLWAARWRRGRLKRSPTMLSIDPNLIKEGTSQLASEIQVLEAWLAELESSGKGDAEAVAARKSYSDMLRSRREMLSSLSHQSGAQAR